VGKLSLGESSKTKVLRVKCRCCQEISEVKPEEVYEDGSFLCPSVRDNFGAMILAQAHGMYGKQKGESC